MNNNQERAKSFILFQFRGSKQGLLPQGPEANESHSGKNTSLKFAYFMTLFTSDYPIRQRLMVSVPKKAM